MKSFIYLITEGPIEICKPPRLTAGSQTLEGSDVTFEASVTTKRAQGMWLKDGTQIHEGDKYKFGKVSCFAELMTKIMSQLKPQLPQRGRKECGSKTGRKSMKETNTNSER